MHFIKMLRTCLRVRRLSELFPTGAHSTTRPMSKEISFIACQQHSRRDWALAPYTAGPRSTGIPFITSTYVCTLHMCTHICIQTLVHVYILVHVHHNLNTMQLASPLLLVGTPRDCYYIQQGMPKKPPLHRVEWPQLHVSDTHACHKAW